jgi:hypothetical protein
VCSTEENAERLIQATYSDFSREDRDYPDLSGFAPHGVGFAHNTHTAMHYSSAVFLTARASRAARHTRVAAAGAAHESYAGCCWRTSE